MFGRVRLTKTEVIEYRLLDLDDSLEALEYIGIDGVSVHLIRQYQTRRLISGPQSGPYKMAGAKYRGYFSATDILAIADIRLRLKSGETLDEIGFDTRTFFKSKQKLYTRGQKLLRDIVTASPLFDEFRRDMIVDSVFMRRIKHLAESIRAYKEEKERINLKTLGLNINPKYSKKLEEYLDNKFKHETKDDLI